MRRSNALDINHKFNQKLSTTFARAVEMVQHTSCALDVRAKNAIAIARVTFAYDYPISTTTLSLIYPQENLALA